MAAAPRDPHRDAIHTLLVEDEASQIELAKINLARIDPRIEVAATTRPREALRLLGRGGPDCVVSDYILPGMSGTQLCREIRRTSDAPFILYTARGSDEVAAEAFSAGADAYVRKEPELAHYLVLANEIRLAVGRRRAEKLLAEGARRRAGGDEAVMEAATKMSQTVAHDLRGPLAAIVQAVNTTKRDPNTTQDMLRIIEDNAVESLTKIAGWRSNTRDIAPQPRETDLVALIRGLAAGITPPEGVTVHTSLDERVEPLLLDPDVAARIVNNLVDNAIEAMPEGGELRIGVEAVDGGAQVAVADTGAGIPEEARGRIFHPLYSTKPGAMGLGLAYCRRAAEALGGTIAFDSEAGVGTTFRVTFPTRRAG